MDEKIEHYRRLANQVTDERTLDGIAGLIAEMLVKKAELHPEQKD